MQEVRRMEQRGVGEKQRFPNRCVLGKSSPGSNHRVSWIVSELPLCAKSCRKSQQSRISRKASGASALWAEPEGNHKNNCSLCCVATESPRWKLKMKCVCESVQTLRGFPKPSLWMEKQAHDRGRGSISKLCIVLPSAWLELTQWLHLFKNIFKHFL